MSPKQGVIELLDSSRSYSWKIGCIGSNGRWISNKITCPESSKSAYLLIDLYDENSRTGRLQLCEKYDRELVTYNFKFILKYFQKSYSYQKENVPCKITSGWVYYDLAKIRTDDLQEIICTILKKDKDSDTALETDIEEAPEVLGENSGKRKVEIEVTFLDRTKRVKTAGLDTLSRNLKEAFIKEEDCDITLRVVDKDYKAHTVILRNRSPVFEKMLQHDMTEKHQAVIDISDCDPHVFRDFLLYLYAGKVDNLMKDNVFKLYYIADKYDVKDLKLDCVDFILGNLDIDIICDAITLATRHLEQEMLEHAISFFTSNAKEIFLTVKWQIFLKEYPTQANELIIKAFNDVIEKKDSGVPKELTLIGYIRPVIKE